MAYTVVMDVTSLTVTVFNNIDIDCLATDKNVIATDKNVIEYQKSLFESYHQLK